ncbi:MAG: hypothetical protein J6W84_08760 [Bacteroidales bacterium]|nr:hypothetical protein [Bacteroidales bacterium]
MAKISYDTILDALKAIATKLNATLPVKKYSNQKDAIADALDAISDADMGGLPAVSGDDNGKVLTVVEGEWAPAAGGGGGGSLIVEITQSGIDFTMNKTAGEIIEALSSGKQIICSFPDDNFFSNRYTQVLATSAEKDYSTQEISTVSIYLLNSTTIEQYTAQGLTDYPSIIYD